MTDVEGTLPLADLIEDSTIYPRNVVDDMHVSQMQEALKMGAVFPLIVVERGSNRIVDGWHRSRAYRRVLGDEASITVDLRSYASEAELLEDAIRFNASHGRRLDRRDQVRIVLLAERVGITKDRVAMLLHTTPSRVETLEARFAVAPGASAGVIEGKLPLKRSMTHLVGHTLTNAQVEAHKHQPGTSHLFQVHSLHDALKFDLLNRNDERLMKALRELQEELARYLDAVGAALDA